MNLLLLTPGAGAMYCGNCLRDNALAAALRELGHQVLMLPLYLPLTLDETDQSAGAPIFFGGINVYLEQKSALFRAAPEWLHRWLASPALLRLAGRRAPNTPAAGLGELTLSMLRGEEGRQARELQDLCAWLATQPKPDVICLSNALLVGLVDRLKTALDTPVVCFFQGEDGFLDALPEPVRTACWQMLAERAANADLFMAPSRFFAERMGERLRLPPERVRVVYNGIRLEGYDEPVHPPSALPLAPPQGAPLTLGFFARMCAPKGVDALVAAYMLLRKRGRVKNLRLRIGGGCGPGEEPLVSSLQQLLHAAGLADQAEFCPNLSREQKLAFLKSLSVFSVPAAYGEAFGLYVLEALAAGVPVVQPSHGAFPELLAATGGGLLYDPAHPEALADALEELLLDPHRARELGHQGRSAVFENFSATRMARNLVAELRDALRLPTPPSLEGPPDDPGLQRELTYSLKPGIRPAAE